MSNVRKAMILAAGFGTRLRPLTDTVPKPLIPYNGRPMIENAISKLSSIGISEFVVNIHHHADKMEEYFSLRQGSEKITLIKEDDILGTGGALINAKELLKGSGSFFLYNSDVDTDADLLELEKYHFDSGSIATLAVKNRETARYLILDQEMKIIGRNENGDDIFYDKGKPEKKMGFCGIHLISDKIFDLIEASGRFDVIPEYMRLISLGFMINGYDIGPKYWQDLGKHINPES